MASKIYLEERVIQDMERMSAEDMARIPHGQLLELFQKLLRSYRIAATVANAAWAFWKAISDPKSLFKPADTEEALQNALHGYSAGNFKPSQQYLILFTQQLEEIYNEACECRTTEEVQQLLFERVSDAMEKLQAA